MLRVEINQIPVKKVLSIKTSGERERQRLREMNIINLNKRKLRENIRLLDGVLLPGIMLCRLTNPSSQFQ